MEEVPVKNQKAIGLNTLITIAVLLCSGGGTFAILKHSVALHDKTIEKMDAELEKQEVTSKAKDAELSKALQNTQNEIDDLATVNTRLNSTVDDLSLTMSQLSHSLDEMTMQRKLEMERESFLMSERWNASMMDDLVDLWSAKFEVHIEGWTSQDKPDVDRIQEKHMRRFFNGLNKLESSQ